MSPKKGAAIAGIVYAVVNAVIGFSTGEPPDLDAPIPELKEYLTDHRSALLAAAAVAVITVPLAVWFVVEVARRLRARDDEVGSLGAAAVLVGGAAGLGLVVLLNALGAGLVAVDGFAASAGDDILRYVWVTTFLVVFASNGLFAATLAAVAIAGRRGAFASWFCTLSAVFAVIMVIAAGIGITSSDSAKTVGLTFVAAPLWMLIGGITMLRSPDGA